MHFTEIRLTNFGQYNGEHVIDLRPNAIHSGFNDRPIVLIGGKNGAGKTTLLEAVKLCLYGSAALSSGIRRQEYEAYLLSRIHRQIGAPLNNTFAGVGVGFVHTVGGVAQTFDVWRAWQRQRRGVVEIREVRRDGTLLEDHEYAGWEQFLHDLLPPGLANLFFFDGEQIQALADDPDYTVLGSSIRALLGLDLLGRLRGDLAVYVARQKRVGNANLEEQLDAIKVEREQIEDGFGEAYTKLNTLLRELGQRKGKIEDQERLLASEGGDIAVRRDVLRQRAESLRADLRRYERAIGEHAAGLLPFAAVPALSRSLRERLIVEEQIEQQRAVRAVADTFAQELLGCLLNGEQWLGGVTIGPQHRPHIVAGLTSTIQDIAAKLAGSSNAGDDGDLLHDLSKNERYEIVSWLDQATTLVPQALQELGRAIEAATNELAQIETTLQQLPAEEIIQPILQRLAALQREVGALEEQAKQQEAVVQQWRQKRAELTRREQELYTRLMRGDDPTYRLRLAGRAQQALKKYEEALQRAKLQELEQKIVECFGRLSRKGNYIRRVSIDPKTFETMLYNHKGDDLPKEQLSAGEKQIYAVAVLWVLRLVSRRALPIIVDTPLGRLDSDHRQRLVQRYFPQASHQVVLLSTDTEIDEELYEDLVPATARAYQLVYQPVEASTQIAEGYFWADGPHPPTPSPIAIGEGEKHIVIPLLPRWEGEEGRAQR
jgi:DNA sulfur modification protein DndD